VIGSKNSCAIIGQYKKTDRGQICPPQDIGLKYKNDKTQTIKIKHKIKSNCIQLLQCYDFESSLLPTVKYRFETKNSLPNKFPVTRKNRTWIDEKGKPPLCTLIPVL